MYVPSALSVTPDTNTALPVALITTIDPPASNTLPLTSAKVTVTVLTSIPSANTGLVAVIVLFILVGSGLELSGMKLIVSSSIIA